MRISKIILLLLCFQCSFAQQLINNIDSVKQLVNVEKHDSNSINNLLYLSYLHSNIDPYKAIAYADTVRQITENFEFEEAYFKSFYLKAKTYILSGELEKSKSEIEPIINAENLPKYPEVYCDCLRTLGSYYYWSYNYSEAIDYFQQSAKIGKTINDITCNGGSLYNIANIYKDLGNDSMSMIYLQKALDDIKGSQKHNMVNYIYNGIASISKDSNEVKMALDSALVYAKKSNNPFILQNTYRDLGYLQIEKQHFQDALASFQKLIDLEPNDSVTQIQAEDYMCLAMLYMKNGDNKNAKTAYNTSKAISKQIGREPNELNYLNNYALYAELNNDYKKSIDLLKKYIDLLTSTNEEGIQEIVAKKDAQFRIAESQEKILAQEIKIQKQRVSRLKILIGSIALLLISLLVFQYFLLKQKRKKQQAEYALAIQKNETESLKHLDKLKTQFFSNISHELRTPLTLIVGPLEHTLEKAKGKAIQDDIQLARRNSKRLLDLVNSILDFSKLEAGKLSLNHRPTPLNTFLKRIVTSFDSLAAVKGIQLNYNSDISNKVWSLIDREKLEKIIINLISNAIKFTPRNGEVTVQSSFTNSVLNFSVSDTGQGIHQQDLPHIFDRFYQSKRKDYTTQGGTGIGLALAKELVELMQGKIEAKSKIEVGSSFSFEVPLEKVEANTEHEIGSESLKSEDEIQFEPLFIQGKKPKILIVDDNIEMCNYINDLLSTDYDCSIAHDGLIAFEKLQEETFDLVTCDVMMPNLDGFELREQLNEHPTLKSIPFILVTARALEEDKLKGLHLGVDDYITKPFSGKELQARVYNLIQNKIERNSFIVSEDEKENLTHSQTFLEQVEQIILDNIENSSFKVEDLAHELNYSSRQLGRIIKKDVGLSVVGYILEVRLQKARQLLEQQQFATVKEVQYKIGIESASYFSSKFTQRFGKNPKEYIS